MIPAQPASRSSPITWQADSAGEDLAVAFSFAENGDSSADRMSDRATDALRGLIVTLGLAPGAMLDENALGARLGLGRTPVREALHRLSEERLVVILPRRAVAVASIAVTDLQYIYETRVVFEGLAARLAARRASDGVIQHLESTTAQLTGPTPIDALRLVQQDFAFHRALGVAADNPYLNDSIRRILGPAMRLTYLAYKHGQASVQTFDEHMRIIAALRARDGEAAEEAARAHVLAAKERTLRRL